MVIIKTFIETYKQCFTEAGVSLRMMSKMVKIYLLINRINECGSNFSRTDIFLDETTTNLCIL